MLTFTSTVFVVVLFPIDCLIVFVERVIVSAETRLIVFALAVSWLRNSHDRFGNCKVPK